MKLPSFLAWRETRVVVVILLVLLATELVLRRILPLISLDQAHLRSVPALAAEIEQDPGTTALIMGNSQARQGLLEGELESHIQISGKDTHFYRFIPDGGAMSNWHYAWNLFFSHRDSKPAVIFLCGGSGHFRDSRPDPVDLGANYLGVRDLLPAIRDEFPGVEDRIRLVTSFVSQSMANAYRVQRRFLDLVTPRYRQAAQVMNERAKHQPRTETAAVPPPASLDRLSRFVRDRSEEGIEVVVINMPSFIDYTPPEGILQVVEESGGRYLDLRSPPGISAEHFVDPFGADPYHLNHSGAELLTAYLIERFNAEVAPPDGGNQQN